MNECNNKKVIKFAAGKAQNDNELNQTMLPTLGQYIKVCFWDKLFCYKGRARRKEYLAFQLVDFSIAALFFVMIHSFAIHHQALLLTREVVSTMLLVPLFSVSVRRFHDTGHSGWWCLLAVVPFVVLAYLLVKDSDNKENKYGMIPAGKTFGKSWISYLQPQKLAIEDNVIAFETQKDKGKRAKRAA